MRGDSRMDIQKKVTRAIEMMNAENVRDNKPLYSSRRIPCELDSLMGVFVREFMHASLPERKQIVAAIPPEDGAFFISFAERMATLAVREQYRELLLEGLVALIIEDFKEDYRDNIYSPCALL